MRCFADTNLLVYLRDARDRRKQRSAALWMAWLWESRAGRISTQVLHEYYVTVTAKLSPGLPLEEAREDVMALSEAFLYEIGRSLGRPPAGISRDARERLIEYHWPGNVRELRNILERAAILCEGGLITTAHLTLAPVAPVEQAPVTPIATGRASEPVSPVNPPAGDLQSMERTMIEQALKDARFNKSKAAKQLGLTRTQLYVRLKRYGLE